MPGETNGAAGPEITDREILLHILRRVEAMWDELEQFRPLLAILKRPDGRPDMIGLLQARREARKAGRARP